MNKMIDWTKQVEDRGALDERTLGRLAEIGAVLAAIDQGELLSDLPAAADARTRHAAGAGLLSVLQRQISELIADLEASLQDEGLTGAAGGVDHG